MRAVEVTVEVLALVVTELVVRTVTVDWAEVKLVLDVVVGRRFCCVARREV